MGKKPMTTSHESRLGTAPEEGIKAPCVASNTADITLSGAQTIDGVAVVAGDRVLVRSQTDTTENGIYDASTGAWTRSTDFNDPSDLINGNLVPDANSDITYQVEFTGSYDPGTTSITFAESISNALKTKTGAAGIQSEYDARGQYHVDLMDDLIDADLTSFVIGETVLCNDINGSSPDTYSAWEKVSDGQTPPDTATGVNSDGFWYSAISSATKFKQVRKVSVSNKAAAVLLSPATGKTLFIENSDGGLFYAVTGASPGTYSDNGGSYCGTQFIPTGGNGSAAWIRLYSGEIQSQWWGQADGVAGLRLITGSANDYIFLKYHTTEGDGESKSYEWNTTSTDADNDSSVIKATATATGRWLELESKYNLKTPRLDWEDLNILWLGTSIPHQGANLDSYPTLFGQIVGATYVDNQSWSGSHITWDSNAADETCATGQNATKGLSATIRELTAKQTAALPDDGSDAYDASCSIINNPLAQGYETRINTPYAAQPFDVVFLDHAHNDRDADLGTLNPATINIAAITKGATTQVELSPGHGVSQYDDITIRTSDIPDMDYWTGEIDSFAGDVATISLNSSGFSGAYSSGGTVVSYDKTKVYDAYNLIINNIYFMDNTYGTGVDIILMTPPSVWSGGVDDGRIEKINRAVRAVADKWSLSLYDMTTDMDIGEIDNTTFLGDSVHPTTIPQRKAIANHIARWAQGGASAETKQFSKNNYIINGGCMVKQQVADPTISGSNQYGVDMMDVSTTATTSAGTIGQDTSATFGSSGSAASVTGFTTSVGGNLIWQSYIQSEIAKTLKNKTMTVSCKVLHDIGVDVNSIIEAYKADVLDDFSAVTVIESSTTTAVASGTATELKFTITDMGDCSNGIQIRVVNGVGVFTTKDVRITDLQLVEGTASQPFEVDYNDDLSACELFYKPALMCGFTQLAAGADAMSSIHNFREMYSVPHTVAVTEITGTNIGTLTSDAAGLTVNSVELQGTADGAGSVVARAKVELDSRF